MKVKIKKLHEDATVPTYAHDSDAGVDLYCSGRGWDDYGNIVYFTGISIEIPKGHLGLIFPRSSVSKMNLAMANCVGVIDSGYRGEIILKFKNLENPEKPHLYTDGKIYEPSDRIGQLIILPYPKVEFELVDELDNTERGSGGFGSTGS